MSTIIVKKKGGKCQKKKPELFQSFKIIWLPRKLNTNIHWLALSTAVAVVGKLLMAKISFIYGLYLISLTLIWIQPFKRPVFSIPAIPNVYYRLFLSLLVLRFAPYL